MWETFLLCSKIISLWTSVCFVGFFVVVFSRDRLRAQTFSFRLRKAGLQLRFVTNTTKEPLRMLHERLQRLEFNIEEKEIFTSLSAARNLVAQNHYRPLLFLEESAKEDFSGEEVRVLSAFHPHLLVKIHNMSFLAARGCKPGVNHVLFVVMWDLPPPAYGPTWRQTPPWLTPDPPPLS